MDYPISFSTPANIFIVLYSFLIIRIFAITNLTLIKAKLTD